MTMTKQVFVSWASSNYTDNLHARAGIMCSQCHGKDIAKADDTVDNSRCLTCHGPMDTLIMKSETNEFNNRTPPKSHLGTVACTLCHHAHGKSKVYCLSCHRSFKMKIQGTTKQISFSYTAKDLFENKFNQALRRNLGRIGNSSGFGGKSRRTRCKNLFYPWYMFLYAHVII